VGVVPVGKRRKKKKKKHKTGGRVREVGAVVPVGKRRKKKKEEDTTYNKLRTRGCRNMNKTRGLRGMTFMIA
jgi:hypothetical protein